MLYNKIGNISIRCIVLFYIYKFYNFVVLSGLLLFVFGVDNEVSFCRSWHTSLFYFRQINVLIILNILKHRQNICQVWKWANYLLLKLSCMALGFANATFYLSIASNCWYFLLLLGYFLHLLLSALLQAVSAISNNTFTLLDFWTTVYTTGDKAPVLQRKAYW